MRTCAVGMRRRSISSRLERGTRATALATAEAVAEVAMARSQLESARRRTGGGELLADVLVHLVQLARGGRIVLEKVLAQPHGPQRPREGFAQNPVFGGDDLRAAASDIDDQTRSGRSAANCFPRPDGSGALLRGRR